MGSVKDLDLEQNPSIGSCCVGRAGGDYRCCGIHPWLSKRLITMVKLVN